MEHQRDDDNVGGALIFVCPVCEQTFQATQKTYSSTDIFPNRSHVQVCSKLCMRTLMDNWLAGSPHLRSLVYQQINQLGPSSHDARPKRGK